MTIKDQFLELLRVPAGDANRRTRMLQSRLVGLGLGQQCGRCGGSGRYSRNAQGSTTCYGCAGSGYAAQRLTADLLAQARAAVDAGKLDAYLEKRRADSVIYATVRAAADRVLKAWKETGISDLYRWQDAVEGIEPHATISKFNARMNDAYRRVENLAGDYESAAFAARRAKNPAERAEREAALHAAGVRVAAALDEALAEIEQAASEARAFAAGVQVCPADPAYFGLPAKKQEV